MPSTSIEDFEFHEQLFAYFMIATFTAYAYDWLLSISDEVELIARAGITWSIAVYFVSRISQFIHVLLFALSARTLFLSFDKVDKHGLTQPSVLQPKPDNCVFFIAVIGPCCVATALTSFLFFLRVRAVYLKSRSITVVFGTLWLITAALLLTAQISLRAVRIHQTQYCTYTGELYIFLVIVSTFTYDTSIFLAISYRLAVDAVAGGTWHYRLLSMVNGKGLYSLSKSLMKSGQMFYLASIMLFVINMILILSPLVPVGLHYILITAYAAFTNAIACHIFRSVALRHLDDPQPTGLTSTRIAAALQLASLP
ncbi:hypothetical protein FIBSPDRAFT_928449 [Athelia psychrophila]|uniref:DUF6533 domain-containing protein n=1 Tax=Athelia psychrophila TaxID=1759441 RepID=A0A166Q5H5_9AGAM|nr:hypothetical protein FIBSPDRAFT_928449 [Fibularhizoctonia sp. CBS 109695]